MLRRSSTKINADFRKDIPEYSDERIIEILKRRDHYQQEAANLAIEEAIKRGIIFSEQDLFAEEYKVADVEFSLFPHLKKAENKHRIRKSLSRSMVILGILPVVYGLMQMNKEHHFVGGLILILGGLWMFCSAQLIKEYRKIFIQGLFILATLAMAYVYSKLFSTTGLILFDYFLPGILFLLLSYALLLLRKVGE